MEAGQVTPTLAGAHARDLDRPAVTSRSLTTATQTGFGRQRPHQIGGAASTLADVALIIDAFQTVVGWDGASIGKTACGRNPRGLRHWVCAGRKPGRSVL